VADRRSPGLLGQFEYITPPAHQSATARR